MKTQTCTGCNWDSSVFHHWKLQFWWVRASLQIKAPTSGCLLGSEFLIFTEQTTRLQIKICLPSHQPQQDQTKLLVCAPQVLWTWAQTQTLNLQLDAQAGLEIQPVLVCEPKGDFMHWVHTLLTELHRMFCSSDYISVPWLLPNIKSQFVFSSLIINHSWSDCQRNERGC